MISDIGLISAKKQISDLLSFIYNIDLNALMKSSPLLPYEYTQQVAVLLLLTIILCLINNTWCSFSTTIHNEISHESVYPF